MKDRLLHGWNWQRVVFLSLGLYMGIQSAADRQWTGILLGMYIASMGLFALGCAGGQCFHALPGQKKPGEEAGLPPKAPENSPHPEPD